MAYVDGCIVPVPRRNIRAYRRMSRVAAQLWREHGALDYVECVADDVQSFTYTSFPKSVKLRKDEVVCFSWIKFKSRRHRDQVNARVLNDPRAFNLMDPAAVPYDGRRMLYGGFEVLFNE